MSKTNVQKYLGNQKCSTSEKYKKTAEFAWCLCVECAWAGERVCLIIFCFEKIFKILFPFLRIICDARRSFSLDSFFLLRNDESNELITICIQNTKKDNLICFLKN